MTFASPTNRRAFVGLWIGATSLLLVGCSVLGRGSSSESTPTPTKTGTEVATIKVGDCLNDSALKGAVSTVPTVDCAKPHDSEAYASIKLDDGAFPGDTVIRQKAIDGCKSQFNTFTGINYDQSTLKFAFYYPTEQSWGLGDRGIICLISDPAGQVKGTLAGAAR
jgi:hypothetical protein